MNDFKRVFDLPYYQQEKFPKRDCLNEKVNGQWISYSTQQVIDEVNRVSRALLASGINKGDKISIVSNNRPQWNFVDLGTMQIGAITVPVYPTISDEDYVYIMNNAETKMLFVSNEELYQRIQNIRSRIPSLKEIFTFNPVTKAPHWDDFLKRAEGVDQEFVK